jgi:hypothetical protein
LSASRLTPLQHQVLEVLADLEPRWSLTGGGALAGFHLRHRSTRDLDLFWRGVSELGSLPHRVRERLTAAGLVTSTLQQEPAFCRLQVSDQDDRVLVDLIADPASGLEQPTPRSHGESVILVDTPHEILVNKLCALLSRSEIRDLRDVQALLAAGGDLDRALRDCPSRDGGFSVLVLAELLQHFPIRPLAQAEGLEAELITDLETFRSELVDHLLEAGWPEPDAAGH